MSSRPGRANPKAEGRGLVFSPFAVNDLGPFTVLHTVPRFTVRPSEPNVIASAGDIMLALLRNAAAKAEGARPIADGPGIISFGEVEGQSHRRARFDHVFTVSSAAAIETDLLTFRVLPVTSSARIVRVGFVLIADITMEGCH